MNTEIVADPKALNTADIIRLLWRKRFTALAAMLLVGVAGTFLILQRQPMYTSTALLVLDRGSEELIGGKSSTPESKVDTEVEMLRAISVVELVAARLQSDAVSGRAREVQPEKDADEGADRLQAPESDASRDTNLSLPNLDANEREGEPSSRDDHWSPTLPLSSRELLEFERRFRIARRGLTDVIAIEAMAESPERAAMLANLYADVYLDEQLAAKMTSAKQLEEALQRHIQTLKSELVDAGAQLEMRQLLGDHLARLNQIRRNQSLIAPDLRLASPALPISSEAFPSRKLQVLLVWLLAGIFAVVFVLFQERNYILSRLQFRESRSQ